ncbi:MAG TPA: PDZ domain-containing protein [Anaerolineae bacterium]|nr:PDZ domain-containing protein [Anaerolineae bacterium]
MRAVSEQLIVNGAVQRGYLGIRYRGLQTGEAQRVDLSAGSGAVIESVEAGGPAAQAGLREGDVMVAANGKSLNPSSSLPTLMLSLRPGEAMTLRVVRGKQAGDVAVTLGTYAG